MNQIVVKNAKAHNLKDVSVTIPGNKLVGFVGKSGSGKSTLAVDVIYNAYHKKTPNVQVFGTSVLFKQISSINMQKGSVGRYLTDQDTDFSGSASISDILRKKKTRFLCGNQLVEIASMLGVASILIGVPIHELSVSTYNKIRFLKVLASKSADVLIVDELATGLCHAEAKIIGDVYKRLVSLGYTIIAIEHSLPVIMCADFIVDLGPDAGVQGGEILFSGDFAAYSRTERWQAIISECQKQLPRHPVGKKKISVTNINYNCLRGVSIEIPINAVVNICGKAAAGKTSMLDVLFRAFDKSVNAWKNRQGIDGDVGGKENIRRTYVIDQSPLGNNSMSTPATYSGIMNSIRKIYANVAVLEGKELSVSDFSYNGRLCCPECAGRGHVSWREDENELFQLCESCQGKRYVDYVLSVKDHGLDIGSLLQQPCKELYRLYNDVRPRAPVTEKIKFINEVGLSYLCLGQPSGTLSGGESQRIKITKELAKKLGDRCVFILDNPTKGLHTLNCVEMIQMLHSLVKKKHTVIISDNNPFVIRNSDFIILLDGGKVSYRGSPDGIPDKYTKYFGLQG